MKIVKIDLDNREWVRRFIAFPFRLYRSCPYWVPPLWEEMEKNLDPHRHPFYEHSQAEYFLALDGNEVVGRVGVQENRRHNHFRRTKDAIFCFFDSVEDESVSQALFEAVFDWSRRRGLERVIGPKGLLGSQAGGVLVEGFDHLPALSIPYNYSYYHRLITAAGFEKETDHLSGYLHVNHQLPERILRLAERVRQKRRFWVKNFTSKREMRRWIPTVARVYAEAFARNYSFVPPTEKELAMIAHSILSIVDPPLVKVVMKGENLIGFLIAYRDISRGLQRARGKIFPLGWFWLLLEKRRTKWLNVNGAGLLPEYWGSGANVLLYTELEKTVRQYPFEHVEVVQVDERNLASKSDMEAIGVTWYKRHRNYQRAL
ncbi:MAG: hypothetical protein RML93_03275 [Anaerolineales bacterium]|nr:hypothetical protein [Anaerolineales bacterium]MCS7247192.1 hypothetical protein [Anaerolineales bacterium]MDW8161003.1 hypothetical protein [Anaerolineales bacterium]MDW8446295.1 hypothetical protein [Anaerolineales bacterium]